MRDALGKKILEAISAVAAVLMRGACLLGYLLGSVVFLAGLLVAIRPYAELIVFPVAAYVRYGKNIFPADYQEPLLLLLLGTAVLVIGLAFASYCFERLRALRLVATK